MLASSDAVGKCGASERKQTDKPNATNFATGTTTHHHRGTNGKRGAKYLNKGKAIRGEETQETTTFASAANVTAWRVGIAIPKKSGADVARHQYHDGATVARVLVKKHVCGFDSRALSTSKIGTFFLFTNLSKLFLL